MIKNTLVSIFFLIVVLFLASCDKEEEQGIHPIINNNIVNNSFVLGTMTDSRDGEVYETITIGDQTWMAENLRYDAPKSYLNPDNPSVKYGRLYTWQSAFTACPSG